MDFKIGQNAATSSPATTTTGICLELDGTNPLTLLSNDCFIGCVDHQVLLVPLLNLRVFQSIFCWHKRRLGVSTELVVRRPTNGPGAGRRQLASPKKIGRLDIKTGGLLDDIEIFVFVAEIEVYKIRSGH